MKRSTFLFPLLLLLASAATALAQKKPMAEFFQQPSKVGLMVILNLESSSSASGDLTLGTGKLGLLSKVIDRVAAVPGKYMPTLLAVQDSIRPDSAIVKIYTHMLKDNKKTVVLVPDKFDYSRLADCRKNPECRYFSQALDYLKKKYQIDQLMMIMITYGCHTVLTYGIEKENYTVTLVDAEVRDLLKSDNPVVFKDHTGRRIKTGGKSAPEELQNLVILTTKDAAAALHRKYKSAATDSKNPE